MKKTIKWGALILWMIVIFLFSSQNGQQSSESSGLIEQLLSIFTFIPQTIFGIELQLIIRKTAHFTEYLVLYLLLFNVTYSYFPIKKSLLVTLIGVFLYACTDELHQAFVPGRACAFTDVLIDTSGGLLAMLFVLLVSQLQKKYKKA